MWFLILSKIFSFLSNVLRPMANVWLTPLCRCYVWPVAVLAPVPLDPGRGGLQTAGLDIRNVRKYIQIIRKNISNIPLCSRTFYSSVLTIFCFSWERYLAICHPIYLYTMAGTARTTRWEVDISTIYMIHLFWILERFEEVLETAIEWTRITNCV